MSVKSTCVKYAFSFSVLFLLCKSIYAAPTAEQLTDARSKGLAYLVSSQGGDGSWSDSKRQLLSTTEATNALAKYDVSGLIMNRSSTWLLNLDISSKNADHFARKIVALINSGEEVDSLVEDLLAKRIINLGQNEAWGSLGSKGSVIDSVLAQEAIRLHQPGVSTSSAEAYFRNIRNKVGTANIGGWGISLTHTASSFYSRSNDPLRESAVIPTSLVISYLSKTSGSSSTRDAVTKAAQWLLSTQKANGSIGTDEQGNIFETAIAAQALSQAKNIGGAPNSINTAYQNALDYLVSTQSSNGSWEDEFVTAAVLLSLYDQDIPLIDTDGDGFPDEVEVELGTDLNVADTSFLERGNGRNYSDGFIGSRAVQYHIGSDVSIVLSSASGITSILSGRIPQGLTHSAGDRRIYGVVSEEGMFPISFKQVGGNNDSFGNLYIDITSDMEADIDMDGIPTYFEQQYGLNANNGNDGGLDLDGDGLTNLAEYQNGYLPNNQDSDGDGLTDYWEHATGITDANADPDLDGLTNLQEQTHSTDPGNPDTDGDNLNDGDEVVAGRNPTVNEPVLIVIITSMLN